MANLFQTIEADIIDAWGAVDTIVTDDALVAWDDVKNIWLKLSPSDWTTIKALFEEVSKDFDGDFADLETEVLNAATPEFEAFLTNLGSEAIQAVLAIFKAK